MNPRETPLIGLFAAVCGMVCCQIIARAAGHPAQLTRAQVSAGLTICLAGVVVGLLLVLCISAFQDAGSVWGRSLGAVGLLLGCALLFALVGQHPSRAGVATAAERAPVSAHFAAVAQQAPLLSPGPSR